MMGAVVVSLTILRLSLKFDVLSGAGKFSIFYLIINCESLVP